ncbi:hypothetical protein GLT90_01825 [Nanohaloarchaea archaeon H12]|nr:hypothetical protein [Nanohaloarchaea archaeon H12]
MVAPPCKGFSDARGSRNLNDERNELVFSFIEWVNNFQPKYVMMENVAGMTTISDEFLKEVEKQYKNAGYSVKHKTLNAANFGVPQTRERVIYFGVREDIDIEPSFPEGNYRKNTDGQMTLSGDEIRSWVTVSEAFEDLGSPTKDGKITLPPISDYSYNDYLKTIRDSKNNTSNHVAKEPSNDEKTKKIVEELNPGEMYRSNRFGDRYRQVWDLLSSEFSEVQQDVLKFIANHRSKKDFRISGKSVGAVADYLIVNNLNYDDKEINNALTSLSLSKQHNDNNTLTKPRVSIWKLTQAKLILLTLINYTLKHGELVSKVFTIKKVSMQHKNSHETSSNVLPVKHNH